MQILCKTHAKQRDMTQLRHPPKQAMVSFSITPRFNDTFHENALPYERDAT
jgi:hypothetical protein